MNYMQFVWHINKQEKKYQKSAHDKQNEIKQTQRYK